MENLKEFQLANGFTVIVDEDSSTPLVTLNLLYKVGSKNEEESKTGFAHLFEHFMFEGSKNIKHFDAELQKAGGSNNAFTTKDFTNYYETLPASNIETAIWLESDRMLDLDFNQKSLDTQISVVCEEFKQNYLNKPYGDVWFLISELCYKKHPYKWPTIGKNLEQIQAITLQDTKDFFYTYYRPNNAILSLVGGVKTAEVLPLIEKWFGNIPTGKQISRKLPTEPKQTEARFIEVERDVPQSVLYKAYHTCSRVHKDYYTADILTDLLGTGESSRLYQKFIDETEMCTEIDCFISGTDEENLIIIEAKPEDHISLEELNIAIEYFLDEFTKEQVSARELEKVVNKTCNYIAFSNETHTNKAFNLAYFKMIDAMHLYNNEQEEYRKINVNDVQCVAQEVFQKQNCNTLFYKTVNKK